MHADQEFMFAKDLFKDLGIDLIPVPAGKHQLQIKWTICTLKERYRAMYQSLPFKVMPRLMIVKATQEYAKWLNLFPSKNGYQNISSRALITGVELDYKIHCKYSFGSYVQVHQENTFKNAMTERTKDAIFLRTFDTGRYKVMNL